MTTFQALSILAAMFLFCVAMSIRSCHASRRNTRRVSRRHREFKRWMRPLS